jgi:hypothetical protein
VRAIDDDVERVVAGAVARIVAQGALLAPSPFPLMPMTSPLNPGAPLLPPLVGAMPGKTFNSSAALRPTIAMFWIWAAVIVALFSPDETGASSVMAVTATCSVSPPTPSVSAVRLRCSPRRSTMPFVSMVWKPESSTLTV